MKIKKKRFAYVTAELAPQYPKQEELTFILAGTEGVSLTDPRLVTVDTQLVLLCSISNPFYDVPVLPYTIVPQKTIDPATGLVITVNVPDQPILDASYYSSPYWDPYALPVDPALTQVNEDSYWNMRSAHYILHYT